MQGTELTRAFYDEVMAPRLAGVPHAAGRLGTGSDVVGRDDERSRDHDWGVRLTVLTDVARAVDTADLPPSFGGHPVTVDVLPVSVFADIHLGLDPGADWDAVDWLTLTGQAVLEVVAGPVFVDEVGDLTRLRARLRWYPDDVWRYALASAWHRLDQELPFVGRTADRGDDLGSRVLTARLVRDAMRLAFLAERVWAPYPKWFGSAFRELGVADGAGPRLDAALAASDWREREAGLLDAAGLVAEGLRGTFDDVPSRVAVPFHDRPYRTVNARVTAALRGDALPELPLGIGSVEQWCDDVDVLAHSGRRTSLRAAYERWLS